MLPAAGAFRRPRLDLRGLLTRNVLLKLAALALAVVVSLLAAVSAPEEGGSKRIPVERSNLPEGHIVRGSLGEVEVLYRGPAGAVRELQVSSFRAELDLGRYDLAQAGEPQELPVRVSVADPNVRVVEIRPSAVAVRLVAVGEKQMNVQVRFENQPPRGFQQAGPASAAPAQVTVRGPADALREVVSVVARTTFPDSPTDVVATPRAVPLDATGREVTEVETTPQNVTVQVALEPARTTRTVSIVPDVRGSPAPGYWVSSVFVDPTVVTVTGDATTLERVDSVTTAPIDVSGATRERTVRVALVLPAGTSLARPTDVLVSLSIEPSRGTRPFLVAVQAQNVRPELVAEVSPSAVEVILVGEMPVLRDLRPEQVVASVDAAGRAAGTYTVDVGVRAPSGTTVNSTTPARVTLVLRSRQ